MFIKAVKLLNTETQPLVSDLTATVKSKYLVSQHTQPTDTYALLPIVLAGGKH